MKIKNTRIEDWLALILIASKPIADMFYAARWMDAVLLAGVIVLGGYALIRHGRSLGRKDAIMMLWLFLLIVCVFTTPSGFHWMNWVKIMSIFPVYYLGKQIKLTETSLPIRCLQVSFSIVLVANLVTVITGRGFQEWAQGAQTFSGVYFFKTDLALAMSQVILVMISSYPIKWYHFLMSFMACALALLSNSRIFFAIIMLLVLICGMWAHKKRQKLVFKKVLALVLAILMTSIFLLVIIANIPFFKERSFISFKVEGSLQDILIYNLMFRNVIWGDLVHEYLNGDWLHILLGRGMTIETAWVDPHSLYVATLFRFGVVGVCLLILLMVWAWRILQNRADGAMYFLAVGLWLTLLVAGVSYVTTESTQYTWLLAFVMGMINRDENSMVYQWKSTEQSSGGLGN